jgi:DMSO/TMAO reductase YedYZ heme-binding membrane subunit
MKSDPTFWILARASGFTAYALLTISVLAGLLLKARPLGNRLKAASVTELHRFLALLGLGALAFHGAALVLDSSVEITPKALLVPGIIPYRPVWTGVGVVAAELMFFVYVSFSVRKLIGVKNWRRLHWVTYGIFVAATVHGLASGTDSGRGWVVVLYLSAVGSVILATVWRALVPPQRASRLRRASERELRPADNRLAA